MIRTSLTMNISTEDAGKNTYLANGAHLGFMSPFGQNIHIQTNHKPLQLIVSFSLNSTSDEEELKQEHKRQLEIWQAFIAQLNKRGCNELHALLNQYNLVPSMLLCLTERKLQAWLPPDDVLYLLRDNELRRVRSVEPRDTESVKMLAERLNCYSLTVHPGDHFLMLPPDVASFFASGEIAEILSGLRQLPAKMSDLFRSARLRGYNNDKSWLAWQILRIEPDQKPPADDNTFTGNILRKFALFAARKDLVEEEESDSEYLSEEEAEEKAASVEADRITMIRKKILISGIMLIILVLLIISGIALAGKLGGDAEETTTTAETTTGITTSRPTPTPEPTPTPPPETTLTVYQYFVSVRRLNLREAPGTDSDLLTTLEEDDLLEKLAEPENGWVQVRTEDGQEGYVYYNYVTDIVPEE